MSPHHMVAVELELFGTLNEPAAFLDLLHCLTAIGFGPKHQGFDGDEDLKSAFLNASGVVTLFNPNCWEGALFDGTNGIIPAASAAGLSSRMFMFPETPAGYRFKNPDGLVQIITAHPGHAKPRKFTAVGSRVMLPIEILEMASRNGGMANHVEWAKHETRPKNMLPDLELSDAMTQWLGQSTPLEP